MYPDNNFDKNVNGFASILKQTFTFFEVSKLE